jgi:mycofactocin system glycosyltransferase
MGAAAGVIPLPAGLRVALDQRARRHGHTLVGGTPLRAIRLSPAGLRTLDALAAGREHGEAERVLGRRLVDAGLAHPQPAAADRALQVTIVIPVRDRGAELERCLDAVGPGWDVLVVDDGSRDRAAVAAVCARHGARLTRRDASGGPAAARNTALRQVSTELVAFLDSDCEPPHRWLECLAGHFDDPLVAAVAPRVRPRPTAGRRSVDRYLASRSPLDMGAEPAAVHPGGRVSYVPTAALLVRREALGAGFDERLRYGEDVDLAWRLHDEGRRLRYEPAVVVEHSEPATVRDLLARRFSYGSCAADLAARHPGRLAPVRAGAWPALTVTLALGGRAVPAAIAATYHWHRVRAQLRSAELPPSVVASCAVRGLYETATSLGRYGATMMAPLAIAAAVIPGRRRPRRTAAVLAALALPFVGEWCRRRPDLDPTRFIALAIADEVAYGAGVWYGAMERRTAAPLVPALTLSPGTEPGTRPRTPASRRPALRSWRGPSPARRRRHRLSR